MWSGCYSKSWGVIKKNNNNNKKKKQYSAIWIIPIQSKANVGAEQHFAAISEATKKEALTQLSATIKKTQRRASRKGKTHRSVKGCSSRGNANIVNLTWQYFKCVAQCRLAHSPVESSTLPQSPGVWQLLLGWEGFSPRESRQVVAMIQQGICKSPEYRSTSKE